MIPPRFSVGVTYSWACDICSEHHIERVMWEYLTALTMPSLPFDWRVLDGRAICPKHTIEVK